MPKDRVYFEENRFCEESQCKHLKRMLVGFIRFIESGDQDANIPEHFFDNVPDNVGFDYELFVNENNGEDLRCFKIIENWKFGEDDCGGVNENSNDIKFTPVKNNVIHLRLIKNDG